ncbi:hypothetical protein PMSM_06335 [Paenibacillus macquariensis subsp. macquariensis]|nr:hypothetical protein PMSM_06335 [Paenibacillus macquariensis subsp. macquariensis]
MSVQANKGELINWILVVDDSYSVHGNIDKEYRMENSIIIVKIPSLLLAVIKHILRVGPQ